MPAVVVVGLSIVLSGCGGETTTTTITTTAVLDPHVIKHLKVEHILMDGRGPGLSVGADGTVFFSRSDTLFAVDGEDGATNWSLLLVERPVGRPAVGPDGSLYFLTTPDDNWQYYHDGSVQAWNSNGTKKWIQDFNMSMGLCEFAPNWQEHGARNSVALGSDGTVFVSRCIDQGSTVEGSPSLFALDGNDGTVKWQISLSDDSGIGSDWYPSPVVAPDNTIFLTGQNLSVAGARRSATALAVRGTDGFVQWNVSLPVAASSASLGANATVLVCTPGNMSGVFGEGLIALDGKDGSVKWRQDAACFDSYSFFGAAVGSDGTVFVQAPKNLSSPGTSTFLALNGGDGSIKWSHEVGPDPTFPDDASFTMPAVSTDGAVYVGFGQSVYALDADTGKERWNSTSNEFFLTEMNLPPVIGPDGTVFVLSETSLFAYHGEGRPVIAPYQSEYDRGLYLV
jgi:outer membrane protein assembly factor BamB